MPNLTDTASVVKKIFLPIIIILLFFLLVFLIYFRFTRTDGNQILTPIEKPKFEALPVSTTSLDTSQISLPQSTPKSLSVFKIVGTQDLQLNASSIAQKLSFAQQPSQLDDTNFGQSLFYSNNGASLFIYKNAISYTNTAQLQNKVEFSEVGELQSHAENLLASLGLLIYSLDEPVVTFSKTQNGKIASAINFQEASTINFQNQYLLSNIPVIMPTSPISLTFNKQGGLIYLNYRLLGETQMLFEYPIIQAQDALKILLAGGGSLVQIKEPEEVSIGELRGIAVVLKQAYLGYYLPTQTPENLQPVWVFEGETFAQEEKIPVSYVVPAIRPEFIKKP